MLFCGCVHDSLVDSLVDSPVSLILVTHICHSLVSLTCHSLSRTRQVIQYYQTKGFGNIFFIIFHICLSVSLICHSLVDSLVSLTCVTHLCHSLVTHLSLTCHSLFRTRQVILSNKIVLEIISQNYLSHLSICVTHLSLTNLSLTCHSPITCHSLVTHFVIHFCTCICWRCWKPRRAKKQKCFDSKSYVSVVTHLSLTNLSLICHSLTYHSLVTHLSFSFYVLDMFKNRNAFLVSKAMCHLSLTCVTHLCHSSVTHLSLTSSFIFVTSAGDVEIPEKQKQEK
jgi:hypothetical protein